MIEVGDTVVVRWSVQSVRAACDPMNGPATSHWSFSGVVQFVGPTYPAKGRTETTVGVESASIEHPGRMQTFLCKASDIVWVAGDDSAAAHVEGTVTPRADARYLPTGSYGMHKDPREAMARLAAEREAITGKPVRVRKTAAGAIAQLDSWMDHESWQKLCPPGHYLGRHWGNFLDVGVWPLDESEVKP